MKKNTKNLLLAASCLCGAVMASAAFGVFQTETVSAEEMGISMIPGASIRMDVTQDDNGQVTGYDTGIRFSATVSPMLADALVENAEYVAGAELGMFIVPQQYIQAFEASAYTDYFTYFSEVKGKAKEEISYVCDASALNVTEETTVNVSILKLLEKNYNLSYQAVAYYTQTVGDTVKYIYTAPSDARTVSFVANGALLDTETNYSAEQKTALANILERAVQLKSNFKVTVNAGEWFDLQEAFTSEITAEDLAFTVKEGDCVTLKGGFMDTDVDDAGEAVVNVTAYDGLVDFDIEVTVKAREIADNEVIDFKLASDLQYADGKGESTLEYVESFNGAQGVLKATAGNWSHIGFKTLKPISEYAGKYLVMRMWIETESTDGFVYIVDSANDRSLTAIKTGYWVNYYFKGETFLQQWQDQGNYYSSLATNRAGTYYIDKIYMTDELEVVSFDSQTDFSYALNREGIETLSYVESFEGAQGVVKVVDTDGWAVLGFKTVMPIATYANAKYLVIRMYATAASTLKIANPYSYSYNDAQVNEWVEYCFDGAAFVKQWADQGNYYSSLFLGKAGTYYIDKIYVTDEVPSTLSVNSFTSEAYAGDSYVKNQWDAPVSYLSEYQGATGVLKVTAANWGCLSFKNLVNLSLCEEYTHLVVRMWVDTAYASSGGNTVRLGYSSGQTLTPESGCWKDYAFDMSGFVSFWSSYGWSDYRASLTFGYASTYYIDCIYAANL